LNKAVTCHYLIARVEEKIMNHIRLTIFISIALIVGCASNPMIVSNTHVVSPPTEDQAQIVFFRSSFVGSAIKASIYDVTTGSPEFLGILSNGTKISYLTSAGKHTFMVVSEAADFMESDVLAGKTYYSIVTPRMGAWKARFSMWPIRNNADSKYTINSADFESWMKNTKVATNSDQSREWYNHNRVSVIAKKKKYWPVWQQKSKEDLAERTLNPEDGM